MDSSNEGFLAAQHFYWGCCIVCKKVSSSEEPLKRCSRCNCMFYCSTEHQKKHWKKHKSLCKYLSEAAEEVDAETFFASAWREDVKQSQTDKGDDGLRKVWSKFRGNAVKTCEIILGRSLEQWEIEMFLFPRACRVCYSSLKNGMIDCQRCECVTYCSETCRQSEAEHHQKYCEELRFSMICDNYESCVRIAAPPIPSDVDEDFQGAGQDMRNFLEKHSPAHLSEQDKMTGRFLSNSLTSPLTLLHVAEHIGLGHGKSIRNAEEVVFHIVGATVVEMLGIIKWEYILHRLPKCKQLSIVFVGLELDLEEEGAVSSLEECDSCKKDGKLVLYDIFQKPYKDYVMLPYYKTPDLVAVFNCGFHEFIDIPHEDTWGPSIPYLTHEPDVPLLFTSYNLGEAKKDLARVLASKEDLKVEASCELNPFRSFRPVRDWELDENRDVFYNNQYFSVVRKLKNSSK